MLNKALLENFYAYSINKTLLSATLLSEQVRKVRTK